ncbi:aminoacyl-tRNA hydrolase [Aspergillus undulatus]|uniref:aminoacyl-tRNA hydrolase n=1 Tax=Aspergillus undulatus TaxID=1810928 RepID=UPI003CCD67DB
MTVTQPVRSLFIASIGNPGRYRNTRHSAGHLLLDAITPLLQRTLPPYSIYKIWQSPSLMNDSGKKLVKELESFARASIPPTNTSIAANSAESSALTLVILHDELEKPLGKVVVKRGGPEAFSLRGHNGLKNIFECLQKKKLYTAIPDAANALSVLRIGVGIGRPESRSPDDVAKYVLTQMGERELDAVKRAAPFAADVLVEELGRTQSVGSAMR